MATDAIFFLLFCQEIPPVTRSTAILNGIHGKDLAAGCNFTNAAT